MPPLLYMRYKQTFLLLKEFLFYNVASLIVPIKLFIGVIANKKLLCTCRDLISLVLLYYYRKIIMPMGNVTQPHLFILNFSM